jgi:hypothetical protein
LFDVLTLRRLKVPLVAAVFRKFVTWAGKEYLEQGVVEIPLGVQILIEGEHLPVAPLVLKEIRETIEIVISLNIFDGNIGISSRYLVRL